MSRRKSDALGGAVDHLAELSVLDAADANPEPPSTPPPNAGRSWMPRWLKRRRRGSAVGDDEKPARSRSGSSAGSATLKYFASRAGSAGSAEEAPAEEEPTESFIQKRAGRMLVPKALKKLDDDKRNYKTKEINETIVWSTMKGFVGYCLFLLVFTIVAFSTRSASDYWTNEGMRQLFVDGPFFFDESVTHEKTLHDVHFVPQFFSWLEGPFLDRIHGAELGSPPRFLHGYNRIIGPVRLRQLRMKKGTCTIPPMFRSVIEECYAPYFLLSQDTEPYGPPEEPELWTYSRSGSLHGMIASGRFATYSGGGYVIDIPTNETLARATMTGLKRNGWIDRATRAVFVDLSCYNANTETFISVRILFEFLPTGGILPYPILRVLHPLTYTSFNDIIRACFEGIFVLYTLFYVVQEGREVRHARKAKTLGKYLSQKWNILDWIVALLSLSVILLRIYTFNHIQVVRRQIENMESENEYVNLQPLMFQLQQVQNLNAINALLLFLKVFKYLALAPQMDLLFGTLQVAGLELVLFSFLFSIVILGFAMAFYMAFGLEVHGYRSVSASLISLFQLVLGIFDYDELWSANRVLAPVLFGSFAVLVILILMNIFLAIINDAFVVVSEKQKQARSLTGIFRSLFYKKVLRKQFDSMMDDLTQQSTFSSAAELMEKMDINGDAYLDPGELEELLRQTKLYEHFTVKELIARFDSDGDGKLSGDEVQKMNEALLRKRRQVDMQLAAQLSPRTRSKVASIFETHSTTEYDADGYASHQGGALYTNELRAAIEEMGYPISDEHLKRLLSEFDADASSALDLLEFTALMARMLGYKELPEEQYKLLRKVFNYVDSDQDGNITPAELKAVVERFGLKMASSQLEQYIQEFDANNDGQINLTEFCNLMSKLHGRLGITTNPTMIAKDLQLTVTKLEQLVSNNNIKTTEALDALVAEAKLDAPSFLGEATVSNAHAPAADAFNSGVAMAATAAAAAAAAAAQRLASQVVLEQKGGKAAAEQQTPSTPPTGVDSAAGVGMSTRTNSRQASKRGVSPESGGDDKAGESLSPEKGRRRRHHTSSSESPEKGDRGKHRRGGHHSSKSKPGRSKKGGSGFGDARDATAAESGDLLTKSKLAATIAPDPVKPSGISISPQNTGAGGSGGTGLGGGVPRKGRSSSPRSREKIVNELLKEREERREKEKAAASSGGSGDGTSGGGGTRNKPPPPVRPPRSRSGSPKQRGSPGSLARQNSLIC